MTFREMLIEDLDQVMEIETDLFAMPWTKEGMFTFLTREKRKGRSKSRELLCQPDGHAGKNLLFKSFQWTASLEIESKRIFCFLLRVQPFPLPE